MTDASADRTGARLSGHSGITAEMNANGSLRRFDCGSISLLLFVGNELEGGPANLYLRRLGGSAECIPLLGPQSPTCFELDAQNGRFAGTGSWLGVDYSLELVLSKSATAWFWHVQLNNGSLQRSGARHHVCAGPGAGSVRRRAHERVLREPIHRSHTPGAPDAGCRGGITAESGRRWPSSLVHRRLIAQRCVLRHGRVAVSWARKSRGDDCGALRCGVAEPPSPARALDGRHSRCADPPRAERKRIGRLLRRILRRSSRGHVPRRSRKGETDHRPARSEASFHYTQSEAEGRSRDAFQPRIATQRTRPYRRRAAHDIRRAMAA